MRVRAVLFGIGTVALLAACGSSGARHASGDERLLSVLSATDAADSFRYQTITSEVTSGATDQTSSRTTDGAIDYGRKESVQTRPATGPDETPFEFRSIAGIGYQRISDESAAFYGAPKGTRWIRTDGDRIADAGGCVRYFLGSNTNELLGGTFVGVPNPASALESLRTTSATLEKVGTAGVRGVSTTHWSIDASDVTTTTIPTLCAPDLAGIHEGERRVEIWTDAQNRLRRIVTTSTTTVSNLLGQSFDQLPPGGPSKIERTVTTEFFDFGVAVHVDAPPADEAFDATTQVGAMLAGAGRVADADWQDVAHGSFKGTAWNIWYARSDTQWRCYSAEGVPRPEDLPDLPTAAILPKHDGHIADCLPSGGGQAGNGPFAVMIAGADGNQWTVLGRIDDSAHDVKLRFVDGSTIALPIDAQSRIVEWSGPAVPAPTEVESGGTRCTLSDNVPTTGDEQTCDRVN